MGMEKNQPVSRVVLVFRVAGSSIDKPPITKSTRPRRHNGLAMGQASQNIEWIEAQCPIKQDFKVVEDQRFLTTVRGGDFAQDGGGLQLPLALVGHCQDPREFKTDVENSGPLTSCQLINDLISAGPVRIDHQNQAVVARPSFLDELF